MRRHITFSREFLKQYRSTILFEGILFSILGALAIAMPALYTVGLELFLGMLFIIAGLAQCYRAGKAWGMKGSWPALIWSIISVIAGAMMLSNPVVGIFALTTLLIAYFFLEAIVKMSMAIRFGTGTQRFWMIVSSLLSLFLALFITSGLPGTAAWVLGLFVGIDLLFFGFMLLGLWGSLRR